MKQVQMSLGLFVALAVPAEGKTEHTDEIKLGPGTLRYGDQEYPVTSMTISPTGRGPINLRIGGRYNWRNQPERLVYMGHRIYPNGCWHQFALVEKPDVVWSEVRGADLEHFEETVQEVSGDLYTRGDYSALERRAIERSDVSLGALYSRHSNKRPLHIREGDRLFIEEATRLRTRADYEKLAAAQARRDRKAAKRLQKGHL